MYNFFAFVFVFVAIVFVGYGDWVRGDVDVVPQIAIVQPHDQEFLVGRNGSKELVLVFFMRAVGCCRSVEMSVDNTIVDSWLLHGGTFTKESLDEGEFEQPLYLSHVLDTQGHPLVLAVTLQGCKLQQESELISISDSIQIIARECPANDSLPISPADSILQSHCFQDDASVPSSSMPSSSSSIATSPVALVVAAVAAPKNIKLLQPQRGSVIPREHPTIDIKFSFVLPEEEKDDRGQKLVCFAAVIVNEQIISIGNFSAITTTTVEAPVTYGFNFVEIVAFRSHEEESRRPVAAATASFRVKRIFDNWKLEIDHCMDSAVMQAQRLCAGNIAEAAGGNDATNMLNKQIPFRSLRHHHIGQPSYRRVLVTFATEEHYASARWLGISALAQGGIDTVNIMTPTDIDLDFAKANANILRIRRGFGLWIWKPYFILKMLQQYPDNTLVMYADAGSAFRQDATPIFLQLLKDPFGILSFIEDPRYKEHMYTKRDAFVLASADDESFYSSPQRWAKYVFIRNSKQTRDFVADWLQLAQDARALTDDPNVLGLPDIQPFYGHRHDQSLFSLLCKTWNIVPYDAELVQELMFGHKQRNYNAWERRFVEVDVNAMSPIISV